MKRIFEWIGGFALIAFSFYLTDKVSLLVAAKSDLMQEIVSVSEIYEHEAIDATIDIENNTIIPGKYGKKVNSEESYLNMKDFGSFNENYLIYEYIKPNTSLEDNKDKYITSGNPSNRTVSLIVEYDENIINYLNKEEVKYDLLVQNESELENVDVEIINGASYESTFKLLSSQIKNNKKLCVVGYSNLDLCEDNSYYLINPEITINSSSIAQSKSQITSGSIILVSANNKIENVRVLLNEIKYKDLSIVYVSELIDEKGD